MFLHRTLTATAAAFLFSASLLTHAQGGGGGQQPPPPPPTAGAKLDLIEGSSASYRVTEQFVGIDYPNDAVGSTDKITGGLQILPDGSIAPGAKMVADLKSMSSDQGMRDNFVRTRTLETEKFPEAVFVPTAVTGVPKMVPSTGQVGVALTGNLTIHGVTKPVTFKGIATIDPRSSTVAGRAVTTFTFADFGMTKPSIGRLANVEDKITLELVYKFKRS
jgi:polyisoprenoid-binding protein YceI